MTTVLKLGGSTLEPVPSPEMAGAIVRLAESGERVFVVHGGGKKLTQLTAQLGITSTFRAGLRVTDAPTLEAAIMALAGSVNTHLTAAINAAARDLGSKFRAVGLSGIDGDCIEARVANPELGYVGEICGGNASSLNSLCDAGCIPVLASIASDGSGGALNVNADLFASAVARLVKADRLLFVTDVPGVLNKAGETIALLDVDELEEMQKSDAISAGMLPKMSACREALGTGVNEIYVVGERAAVAFAHTDSLKTAGTRIISGRQKTSDVQGTLQEVRR